MNFIIDAYDSAVINFAPETETEEILQNLRTILTTAKFSVPLDRDFGIDAAILDKPLPVAKAKLASEIMQAVKRYEPRAAITAITWEEDFDGILRPRVQVKIND